ncbi:hypothetical protein B296_00032988 [Ensete ventricosum]|uniref:Uncharacterized protein n=1 Tax=Ensete ventricosum TaxID=4639 RepID=A0A426XE62_ENSVE|nr:hypothetical protein B296_00032988 [Ensete ventricosum]
MHQVDAVGNSLGVHWELVEGIGILPAWRKRVRQKKIETCRKIIGSSRKACWDLNIGPGFGQCSGISPKFVRRFTEGIVKLDENTLGDRWKKTERLTVRMPKVVGLTGNDMKEKPQSVARTFHAPPQILDIDSFKHRPVTILTDIRSSNDLMNDKRKLVTLCGKGENEEKMILT